jgi:uncharacterized protein (UPF0371 family)
MERGFDIKKYLEIQTKEILERVSGFEKLYLEFGGKLYGDFHAERVLPGYHPNTKIEMLKKIKDKCEIIFCISAKDIENSKMRGDFGMNYTSSALKSINDLKEMELEVSAIIINRFSGEKKALKLKQYLDNLRIKTYLQKEIEGYPAEVNKIVSEEGYGQNPYVETTKPIIVVTGVGPGSGKMSFCLSQLYFDNLNNKKAGFAKFETFPIWNLPLEHPVNMAYEAATADIGDKNMIDPFHLREHNITAINYNRDIENFPILKKILEKIGDGDYKSPTEMGVNKAKEGIIDNLVVEKAAKQEIIRRYFRYKKEYQLGLIEKTVLDKIERIMQSLELIPEQRGVVNPARNSALEAEKNSKKGNKGFFCGSAIEIQGKIITGKNSELLHSESACILNALKTLANIPDNIDLLPKQLINSIRLLKQKTHKSSNPSLDVSEILISLAISSSSNPSAQECIEKIPALIGSEMHTTHIPTKGDEGGLRDLGINLTTDSEITGRIHLID